MCAWAARAQMHVTYPPVHLSYEITARYTRSSSMIEELGWVFFSIRYIHDVENCDTHDYNGYNGPAC